MAEFWPPLLKQPSVTQPLVTSDVNKLLYTDGQESRKNAFKSRFTRFSVSDLNYSFSSTDVGFQKKSFMKYHRWTVDSQMILSIFGVVIMIINVELLIANVYPENSIISLILHIIITVSTLFLIIAVITSSFINIKLRMLDNGYSDWRVAILWSDVIILLLEIVACGVHPLPMVYSTNYTPTHHKRTPSFSNLDGILSVLMFARCYIVIKFIAAHSDLRAEGSYQNFSSISTVRINTAFVFKALMSSKPGFVLVLAMIFIFVVTSWSLRTCEVFYNYKHGVGGLLNSSWLVAMTFLTVGYGDVIPYSYCGRFISVLTGMMGVATTALLVAVLAKKLEQSHTERCVHNFVTRIHLERARKRAAANVIKMSAKLWLFQNMGKTDKKMKPSMIVNKLNQNISEMRSCKQKLALLGETTADLTDVGFSINRISDVLDKSIKRQRSLEMHLETIESKIDMLNDNLSRGKR